MSFNICNALIICKRQHEDAQRLGAAIEDWLEQKGIACLEPSTLGCTRPDLLIVLGGDGSILGVARKVAGQEVPIFGVNFGRVGFLTAVEAGDWRQGLEAALAGQLTLSKCLGLCWRIHNRNGKNDAGVAINDIVLSRGTMARIVNIEIRVNGESLGCMHSDGLIVSTPLGSTGYNSSAGGSILHSALQVMSLTPICPFMTCAPPLVFGTDAIFELTPADDACFLTIDGQEERKIARGETLEISGWKDAVQLLGSRFFARLRACSIWQ